MKTTSGFTEDINKEMNVADPQPVESKFSNLSQCYVSISGHTRIFTATRYGKRYNADTTPIQRQISCNIQNDKKMCVNANIYSI